MSEVIVNLLLFLAGVAFAAVALAFLLVAGLTAADEVRLRLGQRRAMRDLDELLRGES